MNPWGFVGDGSGWGGCSIAWAGGSGDMRGDVDGFGGAGFGEDNMWSDEGCGDPSGSGDGAGAGEDFCWSYGLGDGQGSHGDAGYGDDGHGWE